MAGAAAVFLRLCVAIGVTVLALAGQAIWLGSRQDPAPIRLELLTSQLDEPVHVANAPGDRDRLFVVERAGRIILLRNLVPVATPFLDIRPEVRSSFLEQGLLSIAFHPNYASNGLFYVAYTPGPGRVAVARYHVSPDNPDLADPDSGVEILRVRKGFDGHNGGLVLFGPDGYLYLGIGDGVKPTGADTSTNAQDRMELLGKILRLDVNGGEPYGIPPDNPFANNPDARPEIWASGLRNPWRFSFDRATGDLYIADVGFSEREEIDRQPAGVGGQNYGWNRVEGTYCRDTSEQCSSPSFTRPIFDYDRSFGGSIIGGYVYRGSRLPSLYGAYIFADYKNGRVWALDEPASPSPPYPRLLFDTDLRFTSFGEDADGELYLMDLLKHGLYRLEPGAQQVSG